MPDDPDASYPSLRPKPSSEALSAGDRPAVTESELRSGSRKMVAHLQKRLQSFFPSRYGDAADRSGLAQDDENQQRHQNLVDNLEDVKELSAEDVMIPRVDVIAIPVTMTHEELMAFYQERPHTRLPVYQDTLDDIIGFVHMKDMMGALATGRKVEIRDILRDVMIISPSLPVVNLLVEMQQSKRQLAIVVDEYGGIDGLVVMTDIIEAIVGDIRDEHIHTRTPRLIDRGDGEILADARVYIEDFEERYGYILSEDEREEIDTLGGLVMSLAGHLPVRGEILPHPSGWTFEILDADPRRVKRLRLRAPENGAISSQS
jgi:magnesium and cobalt transporter